MLSLQDRQFSNPAAESPLHDGAHTQSDIESRILELENALIIEQNARQLLEEEFFFLLDEMSPTAESEPGSSQQASTDARAMAAAGRAARRSANSRDARAQRLVAAGFDPTTADWVLTRESELQMQALRSRYEAGRKGSTVDFYRQSSEFRSQLRQELGDARFERYLQANGESLHVTIGTVLDSSPAQSAGLRVGDRIVSYGGERIYSMTDLTQQILQGVPEEQVVIEFLRDDMPMQVVLPRGPVGISGGR
jgi:C-terminal processing protease CtpA/Prc